MSEKIRVLLADDHPLLTAGLRMTIEKWDEFEVTGTAENGREIVSLCKEMKPDLVVMDMQMPLLTGPEAIRQIKAEDPTIRILALTAFDDMETITQALEAGCEGFLLKIISPEKLKSVLLSVADGIHVYDETVMEQYRKSLQTRNNPDFSERELEIIRYVCQGMTNAEIADRVHLRTGTVKNLISLLLSKTNSISRAKLVSYAKEHQLV